MYFNLHQKLGIAGISLILIGFLLHFVIIPLEVKSHMKRKHALKRGWMMRDIWGRLPFSFDANFYIFNVTNPNDIAKGERPELHEVGPFVYDEWQEKTYQKDQDDDDTVSFKIRSTYYFNPEKSHGLTGEEELIVPNYFILALINTVLRTRPEALMLIEKAVDQIFEKPESIFIKAKAKDILFEGIIINCTRKEVAASLVCAEIYTRQEELRLRVISKGVYALSLFGGSNGTDTKRIRVYRGYKNMMDVGKVIEFNKKPNISVWNDEYCDKFEGTDGTIFHPFFNKKGKDDLVIFSPYFCRNLIGRFESRTKSSGLKLLRYSIDMGADPKNPHHQCYCESPNRCLKLGAFDAFKCIKRPIVITNPHFYLADSFYSNNVQGMNPEVEKHLSIIDIEPFSGTPVQIHYRFQTNMFIRKMDKFPLMGNYREALLPMFWLDKSMVLPDIFIKDLRSGHRMLLFVKLLKDLIILSGIGMVGYVGFRHFMHQRAIERERQKRELKKEKNIEERQNTPSEIEARENSINNTISAAHNVPIPTNSSTNNDNNNNPSNNSNINNNHYNRSIERLPPLPQMNVYTLRPNTVPTNVA